MPATIAVLDGVVRVGLTRPSWTGCASPTTSPSCPCATSASRVALGGDGATTVASTSALAHRAGIAVFATGGLGGVHRGAAESFDVSADLAGAGRHPGRWWSAPG